MPEHYVPACYLRQFALPRDDDDGALTVHDLATGATRSSTPRAAAADGRELDDAAYAEVEARFAPPIADVNARGTLPADPAAMAELLAFVASQAVGAPSAHELRATYCGAALLAALHAKSTPLELPAPALALESRGLVGDVLARLQQRHWVLGVAPADASFVTTDAPIHLQPAGPERPTHLSFADRRTAVIVPLGAKLVLLGLPYSLDRARLRLSRREVAALDTDLARAAPRRLYFAGPSFPQLAPDGTLADGPRP